MTTGKTMLLFSVDLYCTDEGEGLPLIVHHGGPGLDQTTIEPRIRGLSEVLRLICFEHRGTGHSARPQGANGYHIDRFVEDITALAKALDLERFALMGHSFGGVVAQHFALAHPEVLTNLILVCSPVSHDYVEDVEAALPGLLSAEALSELVALAENEASESVMRRSLELLAPVYFRDPARVADLHLDSIRFGPESQAVWDSLSEFDLRPRLSEIEVPTLVIAGAHDRSVTVEKAKQTADALPNGTLAVMEGSGHYPFVEEPEAFMTAVREFLFGKPKRKGLFGRRS
ncbi:MAG: alpha/beta fold hydrolase [Dehalococcoidia bacterium]